MNDKATFYLTNAIRRQRAIESIAMAPDGYSVVISPPNRTLQQNKKFHAMCSDVALFIEWKGKMRTQGNWKMLLLSGHAIATGEGQELMLGLEDEMVNIRESSALMSIQRGSSLIQYTQAYGDLNGVRWKAPEEQIA